MKTQYISIRHIFLAGWLCFTPLISMQAATDANSQIKEVMVYPNGAMVKRTVSVKLKAGNNEVKIPLLTPQLDQTSVQVGVTKGNATLESVKYDVEVPDRKQIASEVNTLTKRAAILRDSLDIIQSKSAVLDKERELLLYNNRIGGNEGYNAQTMQGIASYMRKDLNEIVSLQYNYQRQTKKYEKELIMNEQQVNLLYEKQIEPKSCLNICLNAAGATTCELEIQYYVEDASWMPFYEARINKRDNNLHLIQKAYVSQGSKEKWNDVSLKISQNDPNISNAKPELDRYVLPDGEHQSFNSHSKNHHNQSIKVLGIVRDKKTPLKGVLVTCGKDLKTETDESGYYELLVHEGNYVRFDYKSYNGTSIMADGTNVSVNNVILGNGKSEVVKVSQNNAFQNYMSQNRMQVNDFISASNISASDNSSSDNDAYIPQITTQNVIYDVPGKYSIPDDGADHEIVVKDMAVNAEYNYYAVPKLSKDVYLVAAIPNWKKLDLVDGSVKLFLNNMYMGESFINAYQTEDTLRLSIGKDKDLAIERKDLKTYQSTNLTKSSKKIEHEWQITVKNNKSEAVMMTVEDQFPVSTNSDVKVELLDNGGATVNENEGKLTWKLSLKAGEKKVVKFSYSVKSKEYIRVE